VCTSKDGGGLVVLQGQRVSGALLGSPFVAANPIYESPRRIFLLLFRPICLSFRLDPIMSCIVTSTVAACLEAFQVSRDKYSKMEETKPSRLLGEVPSDADIVSLLKRNVTYSTMGLREEPKYSAIEGLHKHDFVCLQPRSMSSVSFHYSLYIVLVQRLISLICISSSLMTSLRYNRLRPSMDER
jgi:hypothetical protein